MKKILTILLCLLVVSALFAGSADARVNKFTLVEKTKNYLSSTEAMVGISPYYVVVDDVRSAMEMNASFDWRMFVNDLRNTSADLYIESGAITEFKDDTTEWTGFAGAGGTYKLDKCLSATFVVGMEFNILNEFDLGVGGRIIANYKFNNDFGLTASCGITQILKANEADRYNKFKFGIGGSYTF